MIYITTRMSFKSTRQIPLPNLTTVQFLQPTHTKMNPGSFKSHTSSSLTLLRPGFCVVLIECSTGNYATPGLLLMSPSKIPMSPPPVTKLVLIFWNRNQARSPPSSLQCLFLTRLHCHALVMVSFPCDLIAPCTALCRKNDLCLCVSPTFLSSLIKPENIHTS